jgi:IS5 family transposase
MQEMADQRWACSGCCGFTAWPTINLADGACEGALYDKSVFRELCRPDLRRERVPDATILRYFRHLRVKHCLHSALLAKVGDLLLAGGMQLSGGTIAKTAQNAAPPSTKNQEKSRNPEMQQTKIGTEWHFGMMLLAKAPRFFGDSAYRDKDQRKRLKDFVPKAKGLSNKRAYRSCLLTETNGDT